MIRYITVLVLSMFAFGAWAQTSPPQHQHNVAAPNLIDGAVAAFQDVSYLQLRQLTTRDSTDQFTASCS
jgi:hypothetical protein